MSQLSCLPSSDIVVWKTDIKLQGILWDCENPYNTEFCFRPNFIPFCVYMLRFQQPIF